VEQMTVLYVTDGLLRLVHRDPVEVGAKSQLLWCDTAQVGLSAVLVAYTGIRSGAGSEDGAVSGPGGDGTPSRGTEPKQSGHHCAPVRRRPVANQAMIGTTNVNHQRLSSHDS
jgi:hypothetical protein